MTNNPTPPDLTPAELRIAQLVIDKFKSGNSVPVDRITIRREEIESITAVLPDLVAAREAEPKASSRCPICAKDTPHAHTVGAIETWVNQFVSQHGYRAVLTWDGRFSYPERFKVREFREEGQYHSSLERDSEGTFVLFSDFEALQAENASLRAAREAVASEPVAWRWFDGRWRYETGSEPIDHKDAQPLYTTPQQPPAVDRYACLVRAMRECGLSAVTQREVFDRAAEIEKEQGHG